MYFDNKLKSNNLQYNMLVRWFAGTNDLSTKRLMFQVLSFFHNFLQNSLQKLFQFIFLWIYEFTKIRIKSFECPKSIRNYKKNNAWNIRRLVDKSLVLANQRTSVLYCRLLDFKNGPLCVAQWLKVHTQRNLDFKKYLKFSGKVFFLLSSILE